jgi:UDP-N-acetylmuramate--alanine ligase
MSAVAKLLLASGVRVSGSDVAESEQTKILAERGANIFIGEAPENIPPDCELVVYTSAAPATNKERMSAAERKIPEMNNFEFLGSWFEKTKTYVVAGTHGKSTTTAMLGLILERAKLNPTVVVGSKVPSFEDGNLRLGGSDLFVVEGDEYARHFLEFHPDGIILNNLELDHTDVFRNIDVLLESFHELVVQVKDGGVIVSNIADDRIAGLLETEEESLLKRGIRIVSFTNRANTETKLKESPWLMESYQEGEYRVAKISKPGTSYRFNLSVPGEFNAMNAAGAALLARALGVEYQDMAVALEAFKGIWRRFEYLGQAHDAFVYSDYGHHPTAVSATLHAAHETFPDRRIVLCFQPHHRNRTKSLFLDFVSSFDEADALILCEIYDVPGRDEEADKDISSNDLLDALVRHDADRQVTRMVEYSKDPKSSVIRTLEIAQQNDILIFMGAGDIDAAVRGVVT